MNPLPKLRQRLSAIAEEIRGIDAACTARGAKNLSPSEDRRYEALAAEREQVEARITQLERDERARGILAAGDPHGDDEHTTVGGAYGLGVEVVENRAAPVTGPGSERRWHVEDRDSVYSRGNGLSYFRDLANWRVNNDFDAMQRLQTHGQEMDRRLADPRVKRALGKHWVDAPVTPEYRVNPNRGVGTGGSFTPPLYLISEYVSFARFGRIAADLCHGMDLPMGTDSISIPQITSGTTTGMQSDGGVVSDTDITDAYVTGPVRTIAGQQDIAIQLLEQSPVAFDEILMSDLLSSANQTLDLQVLAGNGAGGITGGQVTGLFNTSGTNAVTYTDAAPTLQKMLVPLTQAASRVAVAGKSGPAQAVLVHGSQWNWALAQLDGSGGTTGRPLMDSSGSGAGWNVIGTSVPAGAYEGSVGTLAGLPAYEDNNLFAASGGGTTSNIVVLRGSELYLFESAIRTRVLTEVLSGTLQVRCQLFFYVAFIGNRRPATVSIVSGTGTTLQSGW